MEIDDDVAGVARGLAQIDHRIRLRYSEPGEYFVVYWRPDDWEQEAGYLIFTAQEVDHRIVKRMEEVYAKCNAPGYSFADEVEKVEAEAEREKDHAWHEQHGETLERLAHAMREDTHRNQDRVFIADGFKA
jgi:hypothetical protein